MVLNKRQSRMAQYLAELFAYKNKNAPANKHYDLSVGNYVDNNCGPGTHWSMEEYKCVND